MKLLLAILATAILTGCHLVSTEPGHETIIVDYPWFFGHGGIRAETQKQGASWYWFSTNSQLVALTPSKYDEPLDHLATGDNNFINYQSYIVLQWHEPVYNAVNFGADPSKWYVNNLKEQYRTIVRDVTKKYAMTAIMIDPPTLAKIESEVADQFRKHIATIGLKVTLVNVNMGKALPDAPVINEMNNTAAQQQRRKTEDQRKLAEDARSKAEESRAFADNAYRKAIGLNVPEFIELERVKQYSAACAKSTCIIGTVPVVVGK
jgi:regulator of protease activity HflC (stomatin/prohibitin superfamily)